MPDVQGGPERRVKRVFRTGIQRCRESIKHPEALSGCGAAQKGEALRRCRPFGPKRRSRGQPLRNPRQRAARKGSLQNKPGGEKPAQDIIPQRCQPRPEADKGADRGSGIFIRARRPPKAVRKDVLQRRPQRLLPKVIQGRARLAAGKQRLAAKHAG